MLERLHALEEKWLLTIYLMQLHLFHTTNCMGQKIVALNKNNYVKQVVIVHFSSSDAFINSSKNPHLTSPLLLF
jgi:hypothetical protein